MDFREFFVTSIFYIGKGVQRTCVSLWLNALVPQQNFTGPPINSSKVFIIAEVHWIKQKVLAIKYQCFSECRGSNSCDTRLLWPSRDSSQWLDSTRVSIFGDSDSTRVTFFYRMTRLDTSHNQWLETQVRVNFTKSWNVWATSRVGLHSKKWAFLLHWRMFQFWRKSSVVIDCASPTPGGVMLCFAYCLVL